MKYTFLKKIGYVILSQTLCFSLAYTQEDPKVQKWQEFKNCQFLDNPSNDGDSFHTMHKNKEHVYRLYLVDTPETNPIGIERITEQMGIFGAPLEKTIIAGLLATQLSKKVLSKPYTVVTKNESAPGLSKIGREYALVMTSTKDDLGALLLSHGLARSYGKNPEVGTKYKNLREKYDVLEKAAKENGLGAWGNGPIKLPKNSILTAEDVVNAQKEWEDITNGVDKKTQEKNSYSQEVKDKAEEKKKERGPNKAPSNKTTPADSNKPKKIEQEYKPTGDSIFF